MYFWWADVIKEAHAGDHTPVVALHLRYGMILFIASEVMFFVGWFWAFFDFSLFPTAMQVVDGQVERAAEGAAAIAALQAEVDADNEPALETLALTMDLRFDAGRTFLAGADVSDLLRLEAVAAMASRISAWPKVRAALLGVQTAFRRLPGLVADGRAADAARIAGLVDQVRGFAEVKQRNLDRYHADLAAELVALDRKEKTS